MTTAKLKSYDVIVVGAGHAGCEAALAAARLGASVLLTTLHLDHVAQMSCNPAVGGIAKGQVVREIDALGGAMGTVADAACVQFRMLNRGKGSAVWSPRAQCDRACYSRAMRLLLENTPNLDLLQCEVIDFELKNGAISAIFNQFGDRIECRSLVLTTGTFLNGVLHYGLRHFPGGRAGDFPAARLSVNLAQKLGLRIGRLKTGTPPRVQQKTIDFSAMQLQLPEEGDERFSFWDAPPLPRAVRSDMPCYMVYSTGETAQIVHDNINQSPMYQGVIKGIGTRYCPSFEDKVIRFPHHPRHLLYLEPEGAETCEYYLNGISTSLPPEVQRQLVHSIPGLENAVISRYAYAIEYDFIPPEQTGRSLRIKNCPNLFVAGQINGTSGYEEAAGQGLVAGANAALTAANRATVEFGRDKSYIGVMIDDLCTKEIVEPYRLFTSRAEYRLSLRQDNADLRLCDRAHEIGLLPEDKFARFRRYREQLSGALEHCRNTCHAGKSVLTWLKQAEDALRPEDVAIAGFPAEKLPQLPDDATGRRVWRELLVEARYDGYLQREQSEIARLRRVEEWRIPAEFDYAGVSGLSNEARAKLEKVRPTTLAQAGRIDGVTPADVALLQIMLVRSAREAKQ